MAQRKTVLCLAGLDPSGGAGLQADILTLSRLGSHCLPVCTTLTNQSLFKLYDKQYVSADFLSAQIQSLIETVEIHAIKIGAPGNKDTITAICHSIEKIREKIPVIPVVFDPVLGADGGGSLVADATVGTMQNRLLAAVDLITPNEPELQALSDTDSADNAARRIAEQHNTSVLITGGHSEGPLTNRLFKADGQQYSWTLEKIPGKFRGTGCSLASAITHFLAKGVELTNAIANAQRYLSLSILNAYGVRLNDEFSHQASGDNIPLIPDRLV